MTNSNIYRSTVHFAICTVHTPTNALFIKLDKVSKFTLQITLTCSCMFRSTTIIREPSLGPSWSCIRLRFWKKYVVVCYAVVCVCVCMHTHAHARACMRVCVCVCARARDSHSSQRTVNTHTHTHTIPIDMLPHHRITYNDTVYFTEF